MGHNNGPTMEPGRAWRRYAWTRARRDLLPAMPLEIVRMRVRRAREIGLDYKTYATVRASTGRDIVAVLFSTNALNLFREDQALATRELEKLKAATGVDRRGLAIRPISAEGLGMHLGPDGLGCLDSAHAAPGIHASWSATVRALAEARGQRLPADGVLLVGDTSMERDWSVAGRLAGYLPATRYFASAPDT